MTRHNYLLLILWAVFLPKIMFDIFQINKQCNGMDCTSKRFFPLLYQTIKSNTVFFLFLSLSLGKVSWALMEGSTILCKLW